MRSFSAALLVSMCLPLAATDRPAHAGSAVLAHCTIESTVYPAAVDDRVRCLEQRLVELGFPDIVGPDDVYDAASVRAVKSFQTSRGLYADGVLTSITSRQLGLRGPLPPDGSLGVSVLGDSTAAAMRWYDEANNSTARYDVMGTTYDLLWSVESCRRLVNTSCIGRVDPGTNTQWRPVSVLPLMQTTLRNQLGDVLVIMAGYDDTSITNAIDQIVSEAHAQGVSRVFWLTYRATASYAYGSYYRAHNAALIAAAARLPGLTVLDWDGYSRSQPQSVQDAWFESDQIHIRAAGASALAVWLKQHVDVWRDSRPPVTGNPPGPVDPTPRVVGDSGFVTMTPIRVLDTRQPLLPMVRGGTELEVNLDSVLPADAVGAAVNVTAVHSMADGYLTVFDCRTRPATSTLNFSRGRTIAALAMTGLRGRSICVYSSASTDLVVDVTAALTPAGALFTPLPATRWIDTRGNVSQVESIIGIRPPNTETEIPLAGVGLIPTNATAAWLNVVGAGAAGDSYLTVYPGPCGDAPDTSNVNIDRGRTASTAVLVGLSATGSVCVRNSGGAIHLVVDVVGSFSYAPGGLAFRSAPSRLFDSRGGALPELGTVHRVRVDNVAVLSAIATGNTATGFVSVLPCGSPAATSVVNYVGRETVANVTALSLESSAAVCATSSTAAHLVIDQLGFFVPTS